MHKKYTLETYYDHLMNLLPDSDFTLDIYTGTEEPCQITCNICGTTHTFSKAALLARRSRRNCTNVCKNCEDSWWANAQKDTENKARYMLEQKGTIELAGSIASWASRERVTWYCKKCNHTFERAPVAMFTLNNLNCPWCESRPGTYTEEMIKEQAYQLWGDEYSVLQVEGIKQEKGGKRRILVCHNKCGFKYEVNQYHFMHGQGCPRCKKSHGEWKVRKYLESHSLVFQEQYSIKTASGRALKLDFYLEESGRKYAIEYNGIQHYQPIYWFGGEEGFIAQQERDKDKANYCIDNNIELIVIPYNDESIINSEELAQRLSGQAAEEYPS